MALPHHDAGKVAAQTMYSAIRDDARELETLISQLVEQAGHRAATSPGEATAAAFVNGRLRRAGMGVATYELRAVAQTGRVYVFCGALGLLAAALSLALPLLSLLFALNLLVWVVRDSFWVPIPPIGRRRASQNIVGTQAIVGAAGLAPRAPRWRVVLLAPLDAPQTRHGLAALASSARSAALVRVTAIVLVATGAAVALLFPGAGWAIGLAGATLCLLVLFAGFMPPTPTPADGGVAALATMVTAVQRIEQLNRVEVWAVAVGAAGTDPRGVMTLLPRYPFDRIHTLFIALEALAGAQVVYATREGAARADALLLRLAAAAAAADPLIDAEPRSLEQPGHLAGPLRRHDYRVLTILARPAPGPPPHPAALPDSRLVERATRLVVAMVRGLEAMD